MMTTADRTRTEHLPGGVQVDAVVFYGAQAYDFTAPAWNPAGMLEADATRRILQHVRHTASANIRPAVVWETCRISGELTAHGEDYEWIVTWSTPESRAVWEEIYAACARPDGAE